MTTPEPDHVGMYGRAWNVLPRLIEHHGEDAMSGADIASWLIHAPGQHPFWSWYRLSCVHLRDIEGYDPATLTAPNATHEWLLVALRSPEPSEPAVDPGDPETWGDMLTPHNFVGQYEVDGDDEHADAVAAEVTDRAAWAITQGHLWAEPPLSGQTEPWDSTMRNTLAHYRDGHHEPNEEDDVVLLDETEDLAPVEDPMYVIEKLLEQLDDTDGGLNIVRVDGEWVVGMTWGYEAPDSPMAGAATFGAGGTLNEALAAPAHDLRLDAERTREDDA